MFTPCSGCRRMCGADGPHCLIVKPPEGLLVFMGSPHRKRGRRAPYEWIVGAGRCSWEVGRTAHFYFRRVFGTQWEGWLMATGLRDRLIGLIEPLLIQLGYELVELEFAPA